MTSNQIAYWSMLETRRANLERERNNRDVTSETIRHNKVYEGETQRHNRSEESIGWGNLQETSRHNKVGEHQNRLVLKESKRHNRVSERQNQQSINENRRHNIRTENLSQYNYDLQHQDRVYSANLNYDSSMYRTDQDVASRRYSTDRNANMSKYATDRKFQTDMNTFIAKYPKTAIALGLISKRGTIMRGASTVWTHIQNEANRTYPHRKRMDAIDRHNFRYNHLGFAEDFKFHHQ